MLLFCCTSNTTTPSPGLRVKLAKWSASVRFASARRRSHTDVAWLVAHSAVAEYQSVPLLVDLVAGALLI